MRERTTELRPIAWAPGYFAGSDGNLYYTHRWSKKTFPLSPSRKSGSYFKGTLYVGGNPMFVDWHVVVAEAFHGPCPKGQEVRHRDGDAHNNVPGNLLYGTRKDNMADKKRHGTDTSGERHPQAKLTWTEVDEIRATPNTRGSGKALAARFGVTRSRISMIRHNKHWKKQPQDERVGT